MSSVFWLNMIFLIHDQKLIKFFLLLLPFFFTRGTVVGDEEKIYLFVLEFINQENNLIQYLKSATGVCDLYDKCNYDYLGHHLFWFFYQIIFLEISNYFYFLLSFLPIRVYHELFLSLISTSFVILSIYILSVKFKKIKNSFIYIFIFFFGSYGIGFVNGGFIECFIIFLIALKIFFTIEKKYFFLIAIIDSLLIFSKIYFLFFVIAYLFLYKLKFNELIRYFSYFFVLSIILFSFKLITPIDYSSYYQEGLDLDFSNIVERIFFFLLSPSVGLLMTIPFIMFAFFNLNQNNLIRFLIFLFYCLFFSLYGDLAFWGGAGIGGSRYIFPILIIFIEEFIEYMQKINSKIQAIFIIALFIMFLPNINYKNTNFLLVPEQTGTLVVKEVKNYPLNDFAYSPLYFSFKIFYEQNFQKDSNEIVIKFNDENFLIKKYNITPDTVISKLVYVSDKSLFFKSSRFYQYEHLANLLNKLSDYKLHFKFFSFLVFGLFIFLYINLIYLCLFFHNNKN